jgi:hypothetical protein
MGFTGVMRSFAFPAVVFFEKETQNLTPDIIHAYWLEP